MHTDTQTHGAGCMASRPREGRGTASSAPPEGARPPAPRVWTSGLQTAKGRLSVVSRHPACGHLLRQPRNTNTLSHVAWGTLSSVTLDILPKGIVLTLILGLTGARVRRALAPQPGLVTRRLSPSLFLELSPGTVHRRKLTAVSNTWDPACLLERAGELARLHNRSSLHLKIPWTVTRP